MSRKIAYLSTLFVLCFLGVQLSTSAPKFERVIVTTSVELTSDVRAELASYAQKFHHVFPPVRQIAMTIHAQNRALIEDLDVVESVVDDLPIQLDQNTVLQNLDLIDVGEAGSTNRVTPFDGSNVLVGIIDTGLMPDARKFIPGKINRDLSVGLVAQGGRQIVNAPDILRPGAELTQNGHGSVVTSVILGYDASSIGVGTRANSAGLPSIIEGVAPDAEVFMIRVFRNRGGAFFSDIFAGVFHAVAVKQRTGRPVVVNMS
ncbi:MAG: S8 family serine peptidase [Terriglobia bacterium]